MHLGRLLRLSTSVIYPRQATPPNVTAPLWDPTASVTVGAYFGHSSGTWSADLGQICQQTSLDYVILGFVRGWNGVDYPNADLHVTCNPGDVTNSQQNPRCAKLAAWVSKCQRRGKKIFVSVGASAASFYTEQNARDGATALWRAFGEFPDGMATGAGRALGNLTVDGFDFNLDYAAPLHADAFVSTMRGYYANASKPMYLSASPPCFALSNTKWPASFISALDFLVPRFYNAGTCSIGSAGFPKALGQWARAIQDAVGSNQFPRLSLAIAAYDGQNGYVGPQGLALALANASNVAGSRLGGLSLWDASNAVWNSAYMNGDINVFQAAKTLLADAARPLALVSSVVSSLASASGPASLASSSSSLSLIVPTSGVADSAVASTSTLTPPGVTTASPVSETTPATSAPTSSGAPPPLPTTSLASSDASPALTTTGVESSLTASSTGSVSTLPLSSTLSSTSTLPTSSTPSPSSSIPPSSSTPPSSTLPTSPSSQSPSTRPASSSAAPSTTSTVVRTSVRVSTTTTTTSSKSGLLGLPITLSS